MLRHGQSTWNLENLFTGWYDVDLTDRGRDEAREGGTVLRLAQERFQYLHDDEDATRWAIPLQLRYALASGEVVTTTALLDHDQLELRLPEPVVWVVANAEGHGFYRVRPSDELRQALVAQAHEVLSDVERYGLVDDTWASVLAGTTSADDFVALAEGFGHFVGFRGLNVVAGLGSLDHSSTPFLSRRGVDRPVTRFEPRVTGLFSFSAPAKNEPRVRRYAATGAGNDGRSRTDVNCGPPAPA